MHNEYPHTTLSTYVLNLYSYSVKEKHVRSAYVTGLGLGERTYMILFSKDCLFYSRVVLSCWVSLKSFTINERIYV